MGTFAVESLDRSYESVELLGRARWQENSQDSRIIEAEVIPLAPFSIYHQQRPEVMAQLSYGHRRLDEDADALTPMLEPPVAGFIGRTIKAVGDCKIRTVRKTKK